MDSTCLCEPFLQQHFPLLEANNHFALFAKHLANILQATATIKPKRQCYESPLAPLVSKKMECICTAY